MQRAYHPDFDGLTSALWAQFMTRETAEKDALFLAVDRSHDITPLAFESLSTFMMRFQMVALHAQYASSMLEQG